MENKFRELEQISRLFESSPSTSLVDFAVEVTSLLNTKFIIVADSLEHSMATQG
jgi:hypothetical protein